MSTTVGILFNCKLAEFIVVSRQAPYSIGHIAAAAAAVTVAHASNHLARETAALHICQRNSRCD